MAKIDRLLTSPVAGMQLVEVETITTTLQNNWGDRVFAVVLLSEIKKHLEYSTYIPLRLTQTTHPQLTLFKPKIEQGKLAISYQGDQLITHFNTAVNKSKREPISVENPKPRELSTLLCKFRLPFKVSKRSTTNRFAVDCGSAPAAWLSERLGEDVRLIKTVQNPSRKHHFTWYTGLHLITQSSLESLRQEAGATTIDYRTMRPNIIVSETEPFEEEQWKTINIAGTKASIDPCERCAYVAINPDNADRRTYSAILATISRRHHKNFGVYVNPEKPVTIKVGDILSVNYE